MEYHDPSSVFSLVLSDLSSRLPLRNLNWQSSSRPLRQIKSLHLDFLSDDATKSHVRPGSQRDEPNGATSFDIVRAGADNIRRAARGPRHQIPGLQTSPYLRIYVLRCDDKPTYKETERRKIRDWVNETAVRKGNSKSKSGNHDAFEWMILHVVIPDTIAASERRWRDATSKKDSDELKERPKQGAKWPGKSTRTVFDKLRSDFNESGKSGRDRVAQIKLERWQVAPDLLPTPAAAETLAETDEEKEKAWLDLLNKLKTLTLDTFDKRVRQFEFDIVEQESRRTLPGFNFCTFFIYKEGLAKAFESIGLVEDALVIYDELALGLESVLRDTANGHAEGTATTFAPYTKDIQDRIVRRSSLRSGAAEDGTASTVDATESFEEDYRDKIVRSDISVFDFYCYIFSRQKTIILRMANALAARADMGANVKESGEDLVLISEVCWRATSFMHTTARTLRQDLLAQRKHRADGQLSDTAIESLVCSWTYSMAGKVLEETASSALLQHLNPERRDNMVNGKANGTARKSQFFGLGISAYPQRTTSLSARRSHMAELQKRESLQSASDTDLRSPPSSSGTDAVKSGNAVPGLPELVTYRAELVTMQRKVLDVLAKRRGWLTGWSSMRDRAKTSETKAKVNSHTTTTKDLKRAAYELLGPTLLTMLASKESCERSYEQLSNEAMRYYVASTQTKSAEAIMGDLAILKYQQGDYEYAASYFQHVLPLYASEGWQLMEVEALEMFAKCLKALGRNEEYVQVMLSILAATSAKITGSESSSRQDGPSANGHTEEVSAFKDLILFSERLSTEVASPAKQFFSDIAVDPEIILYGDKDGYSLRLRMRHLLHEGFQLDQVAIRLVLAEQHGHETWLTSASPISLRQGLNEVVVETTTWSCGAHFVDKVVLQAGNLRFENRWDEENITESERNGVLHPSDPAASDAARKRPWVFVYPPQRAFDAEVMISRVVHTAKARSFDIRIRSGWNEIERLVLKLRPGSAGLRLHLADATLTNNEKHQSGEPNPAELEVGQLTADSIGRITIPYSLEQAVPEYLVHLEARYTTIQGEFTFLTSARLSTQLPLDVSVHDRFLADSLLSIFTARTTNRQPLSLTRAELKPSEVVDVIAPPGLPLPMLLFESQPVDLIYKLVRRTAEVETRDSTETALNLTVQYNMIHETLVNQVTTRLAVALETSPFAGLSRLLLPLLSSRSKMILSADSAEVALLLNEVSIPTFEQIGWTDLCAVLPEPIQQGLCGWLQAWHTEHKTIAVSPGAESEDAVCSITMAVDVPNVDFVHNVTLSIMDEQASTSRGIPVLTLCHPVKAHLKLRCTTRWSRQSIHLVESPNEGAKVETSRKFVLEVLADADTWLIGGQRRTVFDAVEGTELEIDLLLMPLRPGICPLPQIDVQPDKSGIDLDAFSQEAAALSEVHYANAGEMVHVVRDSRTARVYIPESSVVARPPSRPGTSSSPRKDG